MFTCSTRACKEKAEASEAQEALCWYWYRADSNSEVSHMLWFNMCTHGSQDWCTVRCKTLPLDWSFLMDLQPLRRWTNMLVVHLPSNNFPLLTHILSLCYSDTDQRYDLQKETSFQQKSRSCFSATRGETDWMWWKSHVVSHSPWHKGKETTHCRVSRHKQSTSSFFFFYSHCLCDNFKAYSISQCQNRCCSEIKAGRAAEISSTDRKLMLSWGFRRNICECQQLTRFLTKRNNIVITIHQFFSFSPCGAFSLYLRFRSREPLRF